MKKRIISIILAALIALSLAVPAASAASADDVAEQGINISYEDLLSKVDTAKGLISGLTNHDFSIKEKSFELVRKLYDIIDMLEVLINTDIDKTNISQFIRNYDAAVGELKSVVADIRAGFDDKSLKEMAEYILEADISDAILHEALTIDGIMFRDIDVSGLIPEELSNEYTEELISILSLISSVGVNYVDLPEEAQESYRESITIVLKMFVQSGLDKFKIKLGDVDGDGYISVIDATAIQRWLVKLSVIGWIKSAADFDGDGEITILDATAIQRFLVGLLCPCHSDEPGDEPDDEPGDQPGADDGDITAMTKMSQIFALDTSVNASWSEEYYVCVFEYDDRLYRVKAQLTSDINERLEELDVFDDDYNKDLNEIVGEADILIVDDLTDSIPPQELLSYYVGMTGQQLVDIGFLPTGDWSLEDGHLVCAVDIAQFRFDITFSEEFESSDEIDGEETYKSLTVSSFAFVGVSDYAYEEYLA